ncbi:MAG: hypothetical protein WC124_02015 [Desulfoplanes sp.]
MLQVDISEVLQILLENANKLKSLTLDSHSPIASAFHSVSPDIEESISPTGEKSFVMRWGYIDPEEHEKFVRWLKGDEKQ